MRIVKRDMFAYLTTILIVLVIVFFIPGLIEYHPGNWQIFQEEVKEHVK